MFELIQRCFVLCFRVIETETSRFSNNPRFFVLVSEKLEDLNTEIEGPYTEQHLGWSLSLQRTKSRSWRGRAEEGQSWDQELLFVGFISGPRS